MCCGRRIIGNTCNCQVTGQEGCAWLSEDWLPFYKLQHKCVYDLFIAE
jgi:hypothetical protein